MTSASAVDGPWPREDSPVPATALKLGSPDSGLSEDTEFGWKSAEDLIENGGGRSRDENGGGRCVEELDSGRLSWLVATSGKFRPSDRLETSVYETDGPSRASLLGDNLAKLQGRAV